MMSKQINRFLAPLFLLGLSLAVGAAAFAKHSAGAHSGRTFLPQQSVASSNTRNAAIVAATAPGVLGALGKLGGRVTGQFSANGLSHAGAVLPIARLRSLQHQMPGLSMGEGILESRSDGYQPVGGDNPPRRERSSPSPLDRDAWLASLAKRG